jgi:signal transduction histidine kinase
MRLRIVLLVLAISSLILVSFLVPLALLLRTFAANRATSAATAQAQWMAPLVATLSTADLRVTLGRVNAQDPQEPTSVFLPGGQVLGTSTVRSPDVRLALQGSSFTRRIAGGEDVLVAVAGLPDGTAVIKTFVPASKLDQGVGQAWLVLGLIGMGLLALSVVVSAQLSRSLLTPLAAVARASELLADGDLSARAPYHGPPEVQQVSGGLNRLAARIGELLTRERETLADLSHQLRTPLTALRIDAESLRDQAEMVQLTADVEALTRTVNEIIREARRPSASGGRIACDAAQIVEERAEFWQALAEDQGRYMAISIGSDWLPVRVPAQDLAACVDILLENVFAHTAEGVPFSVRLAGRAGGGAWLTVADDGPGFADDTDGYPVVRGASGRGSTGLGLDTLALGPTIAPAERERHQKSTSGHRRRRNDPRRSRPIDARLSAELSEWSAIVGHDVNAS